ncbi:MAG: hypothetical protein P8Y27_13580 [Chromatiaceae bacterium]
MPFVCRADGFDAGVDAEQHRREELAIRPLIQTQGRGGDDIQIQPTEIELAMRTQTRKARANRR